MASFEQAIPIILKHEGKLVDLKADPGGVTNYGISLRWLHSIGTIDLNHDGIPDADLNNDGVIDRRDIITMSLDQAKQLYRYHFWNPTYESIQNQVVATKIFDFTVNMGSRQSHKLLQRALNALGASLSVDGVLGQLTLAEINKQAPEALKTALSNEAAKFYRELVVSKPELDVFLKGWLNRAYA